MTKLDHMEILEFWFGAWPFDENATKEKESLWFKSSAEMDKAITQLFKVSVDDALAKNLNFDESNNAHLLSLTDSFNRPVYS